MILTINSYVSECHDPYENLALEKYLTFHVPEHTCILYLWQNERTVVIGKNQNSFKECQVDRLLGEGGHLARRLSGGGAVFHDLGNLNFTFCVRRGDYDVSRQLLVVTSALKRLGIEAVASGRNDITVHGRKVSGSAFYKKGDFCYHHGTLLVDADMEMLSRYLNVSPEKLRSNGVDSVRARVANLKEFVPGQELTPAMVCEAMTEAFQDIYGLPCTPFVLPKAASEALIRARELFESEAWLYRKNIRFTRELSKRFAWGGITIRLYVSGDTILEACVDSDAMEQDIMTALEVLLPGRRFCREELWDVLESAFVTALSQTEGPGDGKTVSVAAFGPYYREMLENIWGLFYGE